jgi:hypothetical protein
VKPNGVGGHGRFPSGVVVPFTDGFELDGVAPRPAAVIVADSLRATP